MSLSLLSNGSEENLGILPGWDKSTKNPLKSCSLTLDERTLTVEHYITTVEE
jgi:hypothetical protein